FLPSMEMLPESTISRPEIELSSVDLPAPFEPITVTKSPGARSKETSTSALRSLAVPAKQVLEMLSILSISYLPSRNLGRATRELRSEKRSDNQDRGDEFHVIRIQSHGERNVNDQAVEN